jgi:flagellar biosynthesis/type III secretory pathway chaperone
MREFQQLLSFLQTELAYQEKLLALLAKERAAIVTLNQEEIELVASDKEELLKKAAEAEKKRSKLILDIAGPEQPLKLAEVVTRCPARQLKRDLEKLGEELKKTVSSVRDLSSHNSILIKQSLGLISSTLSIMSASPKAALPTYGSSGTLNGPEDPAFARPPTRVIQEA